MKDEVVTERAQHLLKVLVERYIRDGQPVGSRTLVEDAGVNLSPATVRNVMADLEDRGYVCSPHTSAGRVPTELGFRLFVDTLLTIRPVDQAAAQQVQQTLRPDLNIQQLIAQASSLLSSITKQAGLVSLPRRERAAFRHVEFLPLSEKRVLVVLVMNQHEVQNRIIHTERLYDASELQQASNYLNAHYAGKDLLLVRRQLLAAMQQDRQTMDRLMQTTIEIAEKAFAEQPAVEGSYVMAGQTHLLDWVGGSSVDRLRQLFHAFNEKQTILSLLDRCLNADGVQIFIGKESGYDVFDECSMVTASYTIEGEVVGALGVIGPTRMAYDRVIPMVDLTARLLSAALNQVQ